MLCSLTVLTVGIFMKIGQTDLELYTVKKLRKIGHFVWGLLFLNIFYKIFLCHFVVFPNSNHSTNFFKNRLNRFGDIHSEKTWKIGHLVWEVPKLEFSGYTHPCRFVGHFMTQHCAKFKKLRTSRFRENWGWSFFL